MSLLSGAVGVPEATEASVMVERARPRSLEDKLKVIRRLALAKQLGVSEWWIDRAWRAGEFPQPVRLGGNSLGWLVADVEDWLRSKKGGV
jgi:predicted DNA-binding transcriptional regulator AlpA